MGVHGTLQGRNDGMVRVANRDFWVYSLTEVGTEAGCSGSGHSLPSDLHVAVFGLSNNHIEADLEDVGRARGK